MSIKRVFPTRGRQVTLSEALYLALKSRSRLELRSPLAKKNVSPAELEGKSITVKMTTPLHLMELRLNRLAYEDMRQSLLSDDHYRDKFVAFVKGMLVDSDLDKVALMNRVYEKYGYITIFVKKVERKEHVFEVPSPELRK
jgi:hypothetical protein